MRGKTAIQRVLYASLLFLCVACQAMSSDSNSTTSDNHQTTLIPEVEANCPTYDVFWNVGGTPVQSLNYQQYGILGDRIAIQGEHQIGFFPRYDFDSQGNIIATHNGGIPQIQFYADGFAAHLAQITSDLNVRLPDVNFSGHIVLDFEAFWPIWAMYIPDAYRSASYDYANAHPELHAEITDLDLRTRTLFEEAAMEMLVRSVNHIKSIRPNAKVGYYGYPDRLYWGGYESTDILPANHIAVTDGYCAAGSTYGDCDRALNNRMASLWQAQNGFYPSIYQFYPSVTGAPGLGESTPERNAQYITANLQEAQRLAGTKPVLAYTWYQYHDSTIFAGVNLNDIDLAQSLTIPAQLGAQGAVIWGWEPTQAETDDFAVYLNATLGPFVQQFLSDRCSAL